QERPYHSDSTASRLLSEVKHCRARLVLRWGTTLESLVLFFCNFLFFILISSFYSLSIYLLGFGSNVIILPLLSQHCSWNCRSVSCLSYTKNIQQLNQSQFL
ncbi:hypothetical protein ACHAWT_003788, partial [Skeletonema menzelii]